MSEPLSVGVTAAASLPGKCPKCGYSRAPENEECPVCGIVFSRFQSRPESPYRNAAEIRTDLAAAGASSFNPYAPPAADVGHPILLPETLELAERLNRLGARFIDAVIFLAAVFIGVIPVLALGEDPANGAIAAAVIWFVSPLLALGVWNLLLLHRQGQSLGKRLAKVRIVRSNGERASLARLIVLRWLVPALFSSVPYLGIVFAFVNILFIFRDDRRCLHDHLADTIVIAAYSEASPPEANLPLSSLR